MLLRMFSVHDVKAEAWLPPFFLATLGAAQRAFADCVNDPRHAFGRHPADYTLFMLGSFEDADGSVNLEVAPVSMGNGAEFVSQQSRLPLEDAGLQLEG